MADVSANTGREGCQCLIQILSAPQIAVIYDKKYEYEASYGWQGCKSYDVNRAPLCEPHSKLELNDDQPPDFCTSEWCYVNKSACTTAAYEPSAFFDDGVFYSYETCNSTESPPPPSALPSPPPPSEPSPPFAPSPPSKFAAPPSASPSSIGPIVGGVGAGFAVLILLCLVLLRRRIKARAHASSRENDPGYI